jgi:hypothetical protein
MYRSIVTTITTIALIGVVAGTAQAADPAVQCESAKLKEVAKYASCRLKAEAKGVQTATTPDFSGCEEKFTPKFESLDTKYGTNVCPSEGDEASINAQITNDADDIAILLGGGTVSDCGNGVIEAGEDCDLGDLDGETCTTQGLYGEGLSCGAGCVLVTSACSATRYVDNADGTVTDLETGLTWQKTDDAGGLTDKDNTYTWTSVFGIEPNGTAFTVFLAGLNGADDATCFVNRCDWRIPTLEELETILLEPYPCGTAPCIDQGVFGPQNATSNYWSSTPYADQPTYAWNIYFGSGFVDKYDKGTSLYVRAVRGGS